MASELIGSSGKQFIAQITITKDSNFLGKNAQIIFSEELKNMTILMVQRKEHAKLAPFDDFTFKALSELTSPTIGQPVRKRARLLPKTRWIKGFASLGGSSSSSSEVQFESESEEEDTLGIDGKSNNNSKRSNIRGGSIFGSIIQTILIFHRQFNIL